MRCCRADDSVLGNKTLLLWLLNEGPVASCGGVRTRRPSCLDLRCAIPLLCKTAAVVLLAPYKVHFTDILRAESTQALQIARQVDRPEYCTVLYLPRRTSMGAHFIQGCLLKVGQAHNEPK